MKSILYLVIKKQWKSYIALLLAIFLSCIALYTMQQKMNEVFKMPIAVQDLDQTHASKALITSLSKNPFVVIKRLDNDDAFIEDSIKTNNAVLSFSIPEGFEQKLKDKSLRDAIPLYYRDDFVGTIAQEITSKTLYEEQIPYIVTHHINHFKKVSLQSVQHQYKQKTPTNQLKQFAIGKHQDTSISLSVIFAVFLFISMIQIVLHQRLKQDAALKRLYMFSHTKLYLHLIYVVIHTLLIILSLFMVAQLMQQHMSLTFYLLCLIVTIIYELILSILLFKVKTTSHRLFMTVTFTIALISLYIAAVTGGLI
ncbi:ABC transporter permease [Macrococcus equi]|uniref:ABC transporter permease n=1 Tax=Macrococcus equi TaxID=3395462 RepID=UPI0039BE2B6D